jgi:hypothetical protein
MLRLYTVTLPCFKPYKRGEQGAVPYPPSVIDKKIDENITEDEESIGKEKQRTAGVP